LGLRLDWRSRERLTALSALQVGGISAQANEQTRILGMSAFSGHALECTVRKNVCENCEFRSRQIVFERRSFGCNRAASRSQLRCNWSVWLRTSWPLSLVLTRLGVERKPQPMRSTLPDSEPIRVARNVVLTRNHCGIYQGIACFA
jgi:hypothetical protein